MSLNILNDFKKLNFENQLEEKDDELIVFSRYNL